MIRDLSQTLGQILTQGGLPPELTSAQIVFDRPADPFDPGQTAVDLFLYDIRENVDLRNNEPSISRQNGNAVITRQPLRILCSYLVTAWPKGGTDLILQEHRLLSQVLQVLSRYPIIPANFLQGSLKGQEPPLPMMTARADGLKNPAEFWNAIGNKLRPSLNVTVSISMNVFKPEIVSTVITSDVIFGEKISPDDEKILPKTKTELFRIGGQVNDSTSTPMPNTQVLLVELGLSTITDNTGHYSLGKIPAGAYTLRVRTDNTSQDFKIKVPIQPGAAQSNYNVKLS